MLRLAHVRRRNLALLVIIPLSLLAGLALWDGWKDAVNRWARGELDLRGRSVYEPAHPVPPGRLDPGAMQRLHTEQLPAWMIALSRSPARASAGMRRTIRTLEDPNLRALAGELNELTTRDLLRHAERIFYLAWAWNTYLERRGAPWRLDVSIGSGASEMLLFLKTYRVTHALQLSAGGRAVPTRLLLRVDGTNVVERCLGHTDAHGHGAQVIIDRVHELVANRVWPLLSVEARPGSDLARRFGPAVRREARQALMYRDWVLLGRSARARASLMAAVRSINMRRSDLSLSPMPYRGISRSLQERLTQLAARTGRGSPHVTPHEALELRLASANLQNHRRLGQAVEALTAWFAAGVAIHEARHVLDEQAGDVRRHGPRCPGCPDALGPRARAELSAYMASFSRPGLGYVQLFQACQALLLVPNTDAGRAMAVANRALGNPCTTRSPRELYRRAAAAERRLFGERGAVTLPAGFPTHLPLPSWSQ